MTDTTTHDKFRAIISEVNNQFIDRRDMIEAITVSIAGKLNSLSIAPPGCAKTAIGEDVMSRINGADVFDVSISMSMSDQFLVGPIDVATYREKGYMIRSGKGYIQESDYARIEEVGRAQKALGAYLLPLLNERKFHEANDGGRKTVVTPLRSVYSTSNSFLVEPDGSMENAALNDRFHMKVVADRITDKDSFLRLLALDEFTQVNRTTVTHEELAHVQDHIVPGISVDDDVRAKLFTMKRTLAGERIMPSDRQWRAIITAAKAAAWIRGGDKVTHRDLRVARYMVWEFEDQMQTATDIVNELAGNEPPIVIESRKLREAIMAEMEESAESASWGAKVSGRMFGVIEKLRGAETAASEEDKAAVSTEIKLVEALRNKVVSDVMGIDSDSMPTL